MTKKFDAVEWMRKRREEIDEQDSGLTWQERQAKTLEMLRDDPLWVRLKGRVAPTRRRHDPAPEKSTCAD